MDAPHKRTSNVEKGSTGFYHHVEAPALIFHKGKGD